MAGWLTESDGREGDDLWCGDRDAFVPATELGGGGRCGDCVGAGVAR